MTDRIISVSKTTIGTGEHAFGNNLVPEDTLNAGDTLTVNAGISAYRHGHRCTWDPVVWDRSRNVPNHQGNRSGHRNRRQWNLSRRRDDPECHLGGSKRLCDRQALRYRPSRRHDNLQCGFGRKLLQQFCHQPHRQRVGSDNYQCGGWLDFRLDREFERIAIRPYRDKQRDESMEAFSVRSPASTVRS